MRVPLEPPQSAIVMQILYAKSKWERWEAPLAEFVREARADGFDATEIYLGPLGVPPKEVRAVHGGEGMRLVGQILTEGVTPAQHLDSLERQAALVLECEPILVNCHAGRDYFGFRDNLAVLERVVDLEEESGVPFVVETHRGRATYSAVETRHYLETLPELRLAADFSHWMVVHESDLSGQEDNVDLAVAHSFHVHARVGYEEGPQVPDPRAPEWAGHVDRHVGLWQRIVDRRQAGGSAFLTITPEFGPPQYMHTLPFSNTPVADAWEVNVYMKGLLQRSLRSGA